MTTRPEALRLAEELAAWEFSSSGLCGKSAAELRRLHNEILVYHDDRLKLSNEVDRLKAALGLIASLGHRPADDPVACVGPWHNARLTLIPRYSGQVFERDQPLYASPQPAAWVGLTEEEHTQIVVEASGWNNPTSGFFSVARAIEAKLKEKNHG
jgi:hypothetical protein